MVDARAAPSTWQCSSTFGSERRCSRVACISRVLSENIPGAGRVAYERLPSLEQFLSRRLRASNDRRQIDRRHPAIVDQLLALHPDIGDVAAIRAEHQMRGSVEV